jgi:ATP-dependent Clp protease ATP-binding subunit ClpB
MLGGNGIEAGARPASLAELADIVLELTGCPRPPVAIVLDYATHLHGSTPQDLEDFFVRIDKATRSPSAGSRPRRRSPTIWIVDRPGDLPDWFVVGNDHLREIVVEHPSLEDRYAFARHLMTEFGWDVGLSPAERERSLQQFALECEGETLVAMRAIARVARTRGWTSAASPTRSGFTARDPGGTPGPRRCCLRA